MLRRFLKWLFRQAPPMPASTASVASKPSSGIVAAPRATVTAAAPPGGEKPGEWASFDTTVAGVTYENSCGGPTRQSIIGRCMVGEPLRLEREPTNPVDKLAIKVLRNNGEQIG